MSSCFSHIKKSKKTSCIKYDPDEVISLEDSSYVTTDDSYSSSTNSSLQ